MINAFVELGLPYITRFVSDWRAGKTTIKQAVTKQEPSGDVETRFMDKVERELSLPDYSLFSEFEIVLGPADPDSQPITRRWSRNSAM